MQIKTALDQLDPKNDNHWTSDGLPAIAAVSGLMGVAVKRQEIIDAAPEFNRTAAKVRDLNSRGRKPVTPEPAQPDPGDESYGDEDEDEDGDEDALPENDDALGDEDDDAPEEDDEDADLPPDDDDLMTMGEPRPDSVLHMTPQAVLSNPKLTRRAWSEIDVRLQELTERKRKIQDQIDKLNKYADILTMVMDRQTKSDPEYNREGIRQYLDRSSKAREERGARAKAFIEARTTPKDVASALRERSVLDTALSRAGRRRERAHPRHVTIAPGQNLKPTGT